MSGLGGLPTLYLTDILKNETFNSFLEDKGEDKKHTQSCFQVKLSVIIVNCCESQIKLDKISITQAVQRIKLI